MKQLRIALGSAALISALLVGSGCAEHRYYRTYDPYYNDYHRWNPGEETYYRGWYGQAYPGREYRDYKHLDRDDQKRYWDYRHNRDDHHHDHDHDHDRDDRH